MKKLAIYLIAGAALLYPMNGNSEETTPASPPPVKEAKDGFLPDWDFSGKVYQVTANPIIWSDDRSLAVVYDETASGVLCYTFWCLKRNAQGKMAPIAQYTIWTDLLKKGILLDEKGITVLLEGSGGRPGTTKISHHFPFTIPQAQISFLRNEPKHLNGVENKDMEKEWGRFLKQ